MACLFCVRTLMQGFRLLKGYDKEGIVTLCDAIVSYKGTIKFFPFL